MVKEANKKPVVFKEFTPCCPQQWWVYSGERKIGYVRLRNGELTLEVGTDLDSQDGHLVYYKNFQDQSKDCLEGPMEANRVFREFLEYLDPYE